MTSISALALLNTRIRLILLLFTQGAMYMIWEICLLKKTPTPTKMQIGTTGTPHQWLNIYVNAVESFQNRQRYTAPEHNNLP